MMTFAKFVQITSGMNDEQRKAFGDECDAMMGSTSNIKPKRSDKSKRSGIIPGLSPIIGGYLKLNGASTEADIHAGLIGTGEISSNVTVENILSELRRQVNTYNKMPNEKWELRSALRKPKLVVSQNQQPHKTA